MRGLRTTTSLRTSRPHVSRTCVPREGRTSVGQRGKSSHHGPHGSRNGRPDCPPVARRGHLRWRHRPRRARRGAAPRRHLERAAPHDRRPTTRRRTHARGTGLHAPMSRSHAPSRSRALRTRLHRGVRSRECGWFRARRRGLRARASRSVSTHERSAVPRHDFGPSRSSRPLIERERRDRPCRCRIAERGDYTRRTKRVHSRGRARPRG